MFVPSTVYKELLTVRKTISPKHEIFRTGDLEGLRKGTREVEKLLLKCKNLGKLDDVHGLELHMALGIKGIITEHTEKQTAREGKPTLNTEDLYY